MCGKVLTKSEGDVVTTSETDVSTTSFSTVPQRCDNVNNDVVRALSQRRSVSWEEIAFNKFSIDRLIDYIHERH